MSLAPYSGNGSGTVWENGEFTLGYVNEYRRELALLGLPRAKLTEDQKWRINLIKAHGIEEAVRWVSDHHDEFEDLELGTSLGLSVAPICHTRRRKGQGGITSYGKRMVRNGACRLERQYGKMNLSFLTLTVPALTPDNHSHVNLNWGKIVRVFMQRLRRNMEGRGLIPDIVSVTEVQEVRYEKTGVVALHLHLIFPGRKPGGHWAFTPTELRTFWIDSLSPYVMPESGEVYWDACEQVKRVEHSAEGYLGKYMSKGILVTREIIDDGKANELPNHWWNMTDTLRGKVHSRRFDMTDTHLRLIHEWFCADNPWSWVAYCRPILMVSQQFGEIHLGWVGRVTENGMNHLLRLDSPVVG